jgi:hypothetical protein
VVDPALPDADRLAAASAALTTPSAGEVELNPQTNF